MGVFNGIGESGLNDLLTRRLDISGGAPSPAVEPAIFPTLVLESDRIEWGYLKGENYYSAVNSVNAGGAGTRSSVHLLNSSPGTIVVVEKALGSVASGSFQARLVQYGLSIVPVGNLRASGGIDSRIGLRGGSARVIEDNTIGAISTTVLSATFANGEFPTKFVLLPGWALYLAPNADNVAISAYSLFWRERQALPRELV